MKIHCGVPFTDDENINSKSAIHSNINYTIFSLLEAVKREKMELLPQNISFAQEIMDFNDIFKGPVKNIPQNLCFAIKSIWRDPSIQECYSYSAKIDNQESASFFLNNLDRILAVEYMPSVEDVILSRSPTLVITETKLNLQSKTGKHILSVVDVGGQVIINNLEIITESLVTLFRSKHFSCYFHCRAFWLR